MRPLSIKIRYSQLFRRLATKQLVHQPSDCASVTGVRQDTGYSTESSDSRRSRSRKVQHHPFLTGTKSYSTSTGYEVRELEDLSEIPSEYRELGDISDSESEMR